MNWQSILSIIGSICAGSVTLFQIVKTLINNRRFNRFAKRVANEFSVFDIVKHLDYEKLAKLVANEIDKKFSEVKNEK